MSSRNGRPVITEPHSYSPKTSTNHIVSVTLFGRECFVCVPSNCTCTSESASRFLAKRFLRRVVSGLSCVLFCAVIGCFFATLDRRLPFSAGVAWVPGRCVGVGLDHQLLPLYALGSARKRWLVQLFPPDSRIHTQGDVIASLSTFGKGALTRRRNSRRGHRRAEPGFRRKHHGPPWRADPAHPLRPETVRRSPAPPEYRPRPLLPLVG